LACLFDVFGGKNFPGEIGFDDVLQPGHLGVAEESATRADVGIDKARVGRILPPMGELVAVGIENRIEAKRLNGDLLLSGCEPKRSTRGTRS
jgi:hypothetical protein